MCLFETFTETAQTTTPKELPIIGDPWNQIDITLVQNDKRYFRLHGKKLQLSQPLDRDEDDISSIVFQVNYNKNANLLCTHMLNCLPCCTDSQTFQKQHCVAFVLFLTTFFQMFIFQCAKIIFNNDETCHDPRIYIINYYTLWS